MRAAPPAQATLSGGQTERRLVLALHLVTALVLVVWLSQRFDLPWPVPGVAVSVGMSGLGWWLARRLMPDASGALRWDGQQWALLPTTAQPVPVQWLTVQLDLGPWLLLRLRLADSPHRSVWRALNQESAGSSWHGLRVALQAHGGQDRQPAVPGLGVGPV